MPAPVQDQNLIFRKDKITKKTLQEEMSSPK